MQRTPSAPLMRKPLGRLKARLLALAIAGVALSIQARADGLVVYGQDWAFTVAEPTGWHGDTADSAARYQVNIVFLPDDSQSKRADVTIRVRVNKKADELIAADLEADMNEYRAKFKKIRFADLKVHHPSYPLVSKLFFVPGEFFEYVAYVNPGKEYPYDFSVALSKANDPASPAELAAYQKVLQSVMFMHKAP